MHFITSVINITLTVCNTQRYAGEFIDICLETYVPDKSSKIVIY